MPFDVTMPDGTVIRGVPDGTTKEQVAAKYQARTGKSPERGFAGDVAAYAGGVARGIKDFDPAAMLVNLGTRATDAIGLSNGANAEYQRVMGGDNGDKMRAGGRVVGQIASSAPLAAAVPSVIAQGALTGALTSQAPSTGGFLMDTGAGALTAGVTKAAFAVPGAVMRGAKQVPGAQDLIDAGVRLTTGQRLGGVVKSFEDKFAGTLPISGGAVTNRRVDSLNDFGRATVNKALEPIGVKAPKGSVQEAVAFMQKATGGALDKSSTKMTAQLDNELTLAISNAQNAAKNGAVPPELATQLDRLIATNLTRRVQGGAISGREFQQARSELRRLASNYGTAADPGQREMGGLLANLADELERSAERHSTPAAVKAFRNANAAFAARTRVEKAAAAAAGAAGRDGGAFTPNQLMTAVRQGDRTARKGATARGEALLQDWARTGQDVLPSSVPDSGTAARAAAMGVFGGGAGVGSLFGVNPALAAIPLAGDVAMRGVYSPVGQGLLNRALFERSAKMSGAGQRLAQVATPAGRVAGIGVPLFLSGQR